MNEPICPLLTKLPEKEYTWQVDQNPFFVTVVNAQNQNNMQNTVFQTSQILTIPFYFLIMMFFLFVIVMSVVYVYHWVNFNLGDIYIKNYMYVYFSGLLLLSTPLLYLILK